MDYNAAFMVFIQLTVYSKMGLHMLKKHVVVCVCSPTSQGFSKSVFASLLFGQHVCTESPQRPHSVWLAQPLARRM